MKKSFAERKEIVLQLMKSEFYVPMKEKELAVMLQVRPEDRPDFKEVLSALLAEGSIMVTKRGRYQIMEHTAVVGTFLSTGKGYGFVQVEGEKEDYFISPEDTHGAFHQDKVEIVRIADAHGDRHRTARIVKILEHGIISVVGTYQAMGRYGFVLPDMQKLGQDLFIPGGCDLGTLDGQKVAAEITVYGKEGRNPEGRIVEILGNSSDPGGGYLIHCQSLFSAGSL